MTEPTNEALNVQQRMKRRMIMKRLKVKIARGRKIAAKRRANPEKLKKRAQKQARQIMRKKLAGKQGANYKELGFAQKQNIDKKLKGKEGIINRVSRRILPQVKKKETERLAKRHMKKESFETDVDYLMAVEEMMVQIEKEQLGEKLVRNLEKKAEKYGVSVDQLKETYLHHKFHYVESHLTPEQYAFNQLNEALERNTLDEARQFTQKAWADISIKTLNDLLRGTGYTVSTSSTKYPAMPSLPSFNILKDGQPTKGYLILKYEKGKFGIESAFVGDDKGKVIEWKPTAQPSWNPKKEAVIKLIKESTATDRAKEKIQREKERDAVKHDKMMDSARTRDTQKKNREVKEMVNSVMLTKRQAAKLDKLIHNKKYQVALKFYKEKQMKDPGERKEKSLMTASKVADVDYRELENMLHDFIKKGKLNKALATRKDLLK